MKIAIVIQRYGLDVVGGAEQLARKVAEHLSKFHNVEVLTTCARDYILWKNELREGMEDINGVSVRRFRNSHQRNINRFLLTEKILYDPAHDYKDELEWVKEQGPYSPALVEYVREHKREYDIFIFFTFRYFPTFYGLPSVAKKSILIPLAENDGALDLAVSKEIFHLASALVFNSPEEKSLIERKVPGLKKINDTIGCGIDIHPVTNKQRKQITHKFSLHKPFILYIGRVDGAKGCHELFDYFIKYKKETKNDIELVLAGSQHIPIPRHPSVRFIGFVSEIEKSALLKSARFLIMPSYLESLSLVTLEAMLSETPVLVNGLCDVLKGHCVRSNGGLWYENYDEFKECMNLLLSDRELRRKLGENGKKYVEKNYSWDVVEKKYLRLLKKFQKLTSRNQ
ncbi:MAG: glycosyltransferase family 4 protein [Candidatus Micrarchaeia archaeon]